MSPAVESTKEWIRTLPSTNYRIFVSLWLSVLVVLVFTIAVVEGREFSTEQMFTIFGFLGLLLGLDVTQFVMKRKSFKPGAPDDQAAMVDDGLSTKTTTERTTTVALAPTVPDAVQALQSVEFARTAGPSSAIGLSVVGDGD